MSEHYDEFAIGRLREWGNEYGLYGLSYEDVVKQGRAADREDRGEGVRDVHKSSSKQRPKGKKKKGRSLAKGNMTRFDAAEGKGAGKSPGAKGGKDGGKGDKEKGKGVFGNSKILKRSGRNACWPRSKNV